MLLIQFKTEDGSVWRCDIFNRTWQKFLAGACPQNGQENHNPLESGKLIPQTMGVYNLKGKTPPDLCSFGIFYDGMGELLTVYVRANVEIFDVTQPKPFKTIVYKSVSSKPQVHSVTRTLKVQKS